MSSLNVRFETAVNAVIDSLEASGYQIAEASVDSDAVPHIVATSDDELLFVLVQGLEGPHLADFSEEIYYAKMLPFIEAVTWHPAAAAAANLAASHAGRAALAMVGLIETEDLDEAGDPIYLAKVFPLRAVDETGLVAQLQEGT
jgi:hypothetical protein